MTTSLELDIRSHLQAYLLGEATLEAFAGWFWPATFSMTTEDDCHLVALVGEIQLRLSEFNAGHWTEPEFHEQMHRILNATVEHALG